MSESNIYQIARVIYSLSKNQNVDTNKLATLVADYVSKNQMTKDLDKIMRQFNKIRQEKDGVKEVDVVSSYPLSDEIKNQIKQQIDGKQVILNQKIDKSVIGGLRIESKDMYLDLTVRGRLNRMKTGVIN